MADEMVLETQKWLNRTYGNNPAFGSVAETGRTGWDTVNGLIRALQLELGISATANNFGPGTQSRFSSRYPSGIAKNTTSSNVHAIIQGGLWAKGYPAEYGAITTRFTDNVARSIQTLKADIGLSDTSSTIDLELMMALLSMKQFKLLSAYGGNVFIRHAQQIINRDYKAYTGIVPTDGLYGREMNTALVQVLQSLEGYTPAQATGNFGSGTRSKLRTISGGTSDWIWLATVALVCNGYKAMLSSTWSPDLESVLRKFQADYSLPVTGTLTPTTWMSLLTSKGDPDRACIACDTRFEITDELAEYLKTDGYKIVGRYLSEPGQSGKSEKDYFKALRSGELERIIRHGLYYFPIFQEYSTSLSNFTPEIGARHALEAQQAAERLGVPATTIYFAVDYDATDPEVTSNILPYFRAIKANLGGGYGVGIYASRNICSRAIEAGFASASFVSDMSTGFSGNLGFPIPNGWVFDQFAEISGYRNKWDLDRVAYSGRAAVCSSVIAQPSSTTDDPNPATGSSDPLVLWTQRTEDECIKAFSGATSQFKPYSTFIGEFILGWLRKPTYWSSSFSSAVMWQTYTPEVSPSPEITAARLMCEGVCDKQPQIKGTLPRRDIAHLAATLLGYLTWGLETDKDSYTLGDLGGWPLDLLQIWGTYERDSNPGDLYTWVQSHLGSLENGGGFGYADILADADAWLIASLLKQKQSEHSLSEAMTSVFSESETSRIRRFYSERFGGSADNVVHAFQKLSDGIDAGSFDNIIGSQSLLKKAAHASELPDRVESEILARVYAAFLAKPRR